MNARGVVWGSNLCLLQVAAVSGVRSLLEEEQSARILHQRRKTVQPSCLGACPNGVLAGAEEDERSC